MRKKKVQRRRRKIRIAEITLRGWIVTILLGLPLLPIPASSTLEGEEFSIRGSSTSEYWVYRKDYQENFESRLEMHLTYKGFFGRVGYFMWEPSQPRVSIKYPNFTLGYSSTPLDIEVGHYYATFGRGLVLREYLDKDFKHDKSLTGLIITANMSPISITLLSGRPKNLLFEGDKYEILNDTTDILRGADLSLSPNRKISFGGSYLRFTSKSDIEPCAFTELIGGNLSYSIGDWDSYLEYAQQLKCSPARGRIRGEGIYFSISGGLDAVGLTAEYTNYRDLGSGGSEYRYNDPPTPLRSGLSINRGLDEWGGSTMISASLNPSLYFEAEYGFLETGDRSKWAGEWYSDLKYDFTEATSFSLGVERRNEKEIETGIMKLDTRPRAAILCYFLSGYSVELEFSHGFIKEDHRYVGSEDRETIDYAERSLLLSYSHSPFFSASIRAEHRGKTIERLSPKTHWLSTEIVTDLRPNVSLRLILGSIRAGLICSGGVCRFEPDFEGAKVTLSYIF